MRTTTLLGPIIEFRDVVESFRHDGVLVPDWQQRLVGASQGFAAHGLRVDDRRLVALGGRVAELADSDLATSPLTHALSAEVEHLMDEEQVSDPVEPNGEVNR